MAFAPGHKKAGGRAKGTRNRDKAQLQALADKLKVDPFKILLLFAKGDWKALKYENECYFSEKADGSVKMGYVITPELRAKCAADACKYLIPQLKAVEHTTSSDDPRIGAVDGLTAEVRALTDELLAIARDKPEQSK